MEPTNGCSCFSLRVPPSFPGLLVVVALIGLSHNGLGVVGGDYANLVGLGGCGLECALHAILGVYPTDELMGLWIMFMSSCIFGRRIASLRRHRPRPPGLLSLSCSAITPGVGWYFSGRDCHSDHDDVSHTRCHHSRHLHGLHNFLATAICYYSVPLYDRGRYRL